MAEPPSFSLRMLAGPALILFLKLCACLGQMEINEINAMSKLLGEDLKSTFQEATKSADILTMYRRLAKSEEYDPRSELAKYKLIIDSYLKKRAKMAWDAKLSLQSNEFDNLSKKDARKFNDMENPEFVRYMNAKTDSNMAILYASDHSGERIIANATDLFTYAPNANFYGKRINLTQSTVHVPTPVYNRNPQLLEHIKWSNINKKYRANKDSTRDLGFQMFCSQTGFMRYYPATTWVWDGGEDFELPIDLYDCRSTEWYINGATLSKNVLIMLDLSGSMLGQRYEIAKQTIEIIMDTLSDNDFFNVLSFSKQAKFLTECEGSLLQATLRNKKFMRSLLNNVSAEGKADYDLGLEKAFRTLLGLEMRPNWTSPEELKREGAVDMLRQFNRTVTSFEGHVIGMTTEYLNAIQAAVQRLKNFTSRSNINMGCNNVIMLLTDGAPDFYKDQFETYNKEKQIRFFSFLIGEEATDFEQVRWMACTNKGFMAHISNLADVREKVQYYIKVMSRTIAQQSTEITEKDGVWSGMYRERLYFSYTDDPRDEFLKGAPGEDMVVMHTDSPKSDKLVTTVSYPVVHNYTFMGVAGVTVPIVELEQLAPSNMLGALSYTFLLDNNGYVMFHPQLRPIIPSTNEPKPNYNSMDILELEVPQDQHVTWSKSSKFSPFACRPGSNEPSCLRHERWIYKLNTTVKHLVVAYRLDYDSEMRNGMIRCDNTTPKELDILYATDDVRRVYRQTNVYFAECIDGALFTVGLASSKKDAYRLSRQSDSFNYRSVEDSWFSGKWKIHPLWRYCLMNDSEIDALMSAEQGFRAYAKQMQEYGKIPQLCNLPERRDLVHRLLLDLEATAGLHSLWDNDWKVDISKGVHLAFFAAPSGLIRYIDGLLPFMEYFDTTWVPPKERLPEDEMGRNVSMPPTEFPLPIFPFGPKAYPKRENYSHFILERNTNSTQDMYFQRAVRTNKRIIFDVNLRTKMWYGEETVSTYGHPENVSVLVNAYQALYLDDALIGVVGMEMMYDSLAAMVAQSVKGCAPGDDQTWCFLLDEHAYVVYSSLNTFRYSYPWSRQANEVKQSYIGQWFGHINRVTQKTTRLLFEKGFYTQANYVDYQALCPPDVQPTTLGAARLLNPIYNALKAITWLCWRMFHLLKDYRIFAILSSVFKPSQAFTATFSTPDDPILPCDMHSAFALANWGQPNWDAGGIPYEDGAVLTDDSYTHTCAQNCIVKMFASWVKNTNLLLVVVSKKDASQTGCYDEAMCPKDPTDATKVQFGFRKVYNASDKRTGMVEGAQKMSLDPSDPGTQEEGHCRNAVSKERKAPTKCLHSIEDEEELPCDRCALCFMSPTVLLICIFSFVVSFNRLTS